LKKNKHEINETNIKELSLGIHWRTAPGEVEKIRKSYRESSKPQREMRKTQIRAR
jgi:hypothetical protein